MVCVVFRSVGLFWSSWSLPKDGVRTYVRTYRVHKTVVGATRRKKGRGIRTAVAAACRKKKSTIHQAHSHSFTYIYIYIYIIYIYIYSLSRPYYRYDERWKRLVCCSSGQLDRSSIYCSWCSGVWSLLHLAHTCWRCRKSKPSGGGVVCGFVGK
jgi:hypothetical protein